MFRLNIRYGFLGNMKKGFTVLLLISVSTLCSGAGYGEWNRLHDAAVTLLVAQRYEEALAAEAKALKIAEQEEPAMIWFSLMSLGLIYERTKHFQEAEAMFQRALVIQEKNGDVLLINGSREAIAKLYEAQGRYKEAEMVYLQILANLEKRYGPQNEMITTGLNNLIDLYGRTNRHEEAQQLESRAVEIYKRTYPRPMPKQ